MEENIIITEINPKNKDENGHKQIAGAILIAGILIAGAIMLRGNPMPASNNTVATNDTETEINIAKVGSSDKTLGNPNAPVTLVMYEDFQCPWCGKFVEESETTLRNTLVKEGKVQLVYRDFAFLGTESVKAAEAARCAGDQNKFWEYHDYLYSNQNGENQGNFSDDRLKSFAVTIGLNNTTFDRCLDTDKYAAAVASSRVEGNKSGVRGTPTGFILKNGKVVDVIDTYLPTATVLQKINTALK